MNRQRGDIVVTLIIYALIAAAVGGAIYGAYRHVENWCNDACKAQTERADTLQAEKKQAQDRATALALKWAEQVDKTEVAAKARREANDVTFASLKNRARSLPVRGTLTLGRDTQRLLLDASRAANAATPAAKPYEGADAVPAPSESASVIVIDERDLANSWIDAGLAYKDAVDLFHACRDHYTGLQAARLAEALH